VRGHIKQCNGAQGLPGRCGKVYRWEKEGGEFLRKKEKMPAPWIIWIGWKKKFKRGTKKALLGKRWVGVLPNWKRFRSKGERKTKGKKNGTASGRKFQTTHLKSNDERRKNFKGGQRSVQGGRWTAKTR